MKEPLDGCIPSESHYGLSDSTVLERTEDLFTIERRLSSNFQLIIQHRDVDKAFEVLL